MGVLASVKAIIDPECQEAWSNNQTSLLEMESRSMQHPSLTRSQISQLKGPLDDCKQALDEVEMKLISASASSKFKLSRTAQRLIWPLKEKDTLALIRRLESHKATFLCALTAQNLLVVVVSIPFTQTDESSLVGLQVQNVVGDIRDSQNRLERRLDGPGNH